MTGIANSTDIVSCIVQAGGFVERWQTLLAGLVAMAAAFIGGHFINRQIAASDAIEVERRRRKFAAVRAVLPLTLSSLCDYARKCGMALKTILNQRSGEAIPHSAIFPDFPDLPNGVVTELREAIEFGDERLEQSVAQLLSDVQLQSARLRGLQENHPKPRQVTTVSNVEDMVLDTSKIYARAVGLFEFARRKTENIHCQLSVGDVTSALNNLGFWSTDFERIHSTAARRNKEHS